MYTRARTGVRSAACSAPGRCGGAEKCCWSTGGGRDGALLGAVLPGEHLEMTVHPQAVAEALLALLAALPR